MEKIVFSDGDSIRVLDEGEEGTYASQYIADYRERMRRMVKNKEWKHSGMGAMFRGDTMSEVGMDSETRVDAYINSVHAAGEDKVLYTFTVNQTSGVIEKTLSAKKDGERFILHTNDGELLSSDYNVTDGKFVAELKRGEISSDLVLLDTERGDYVSITDGDSRDENPSFSKKRPGVILYDSLAAGRNARGEFVEYAPAAVYEYDLNTLDLKEIRASEKYSYIKPVEDENGDIYCIRKPAKERDRHNPVVEILLIPYRLLMAIVNFIQIFVVFFTGKTMTGGGNNPAKGRDTDSRQMIIRGNVIEVDKEIARNKKFKDKDLAFIPASWKLVRIRGGEEEEMKSGICDFSLAEGGVVCTNGRKVFFLKEGKSEKIAEGELVLNVATVTRAPESGDLFDL
ncbi:hypothetical protein ESZ91_04695 [Candidatus Borkfalkia ceftriaxoniphila]|uniref:Uncharacterized protein n=1 Tax=Candidatus Borkfalkia ceftriaxoniphila TaxID=2508949 RepID=A0A4Q2KDU7_9FIRM|nr:hypothetical protein [Candidatus Borkfalkia ceftriaxoniphila]RXZ61692.1 hypothetical protein ESZ91_04695 [Candidatus Borkfalkia ceftriaxoniphila]